MKLIKLVAVAIFVSVMFSSCEKNTQKQDERNANRDQMKADTQANLAGDSLGNTAEHQAKADEYQSQEEMNAAMADVSIPKFDSPVANEYAKKIGNDVSDFVNSNDYQNAGKYVDKLQEDLNKLSNKVANGEITEEDAEAIATYGENLANAVGIEITPVVIE